MDLFDENEEKEDQAVREEIHGLMTNMTVEQMAVNDIFKICGLRSGSGSRGSPGHSLSLSNEEERLMQQILEDEG